MPSFSNHCAKYEEASEGRDPACAGLCGRIVSRSTSTSFNGREDGRRYRNRDGTIDIVASVADSENSEDENNKQKRLAHVSNIASHASHG